MLTEQMRSFAPRQLQRLSRNCCLPGTFAGRMHLTFAEGLQETFDFGTFRVWMTRWLSDYTIMVVGG